MASRGPAGPLMLSFLVLAGVLLFAIVRPPRIPEAVVAVPGALLVVLLHAVPVPAALAEVRVLAPTMGFLAAVLLLAHLADSARVFAWAGHLAARAGRGSGRRLLAVVFAIAAVVTAALSLDATVVLLTPVVLLTAGTLGRPARPYAFACAHLANSASLLLPVSNLTNLLAFAATGLAFTRFTALMALPWLAAAGVEYLVFRRFFAAELAAEPAAGPPADTATAPTSGAAAGAAPTTGPPAAALLVLAATLVGFTLAEPLGLSPAWVALAGAGALGVRELWYAPGPDRRPLLWRMARASSPGFLLLVFALGVIVVAVRRAGLGLVVDALLPPHASLTSLLLVAGLAALLANLVNNLPATLVLLPAVTHSPPLILAMLLGVNIGPNLTYTGSLATLLWRRIMHERDQAAQAADFLRLGALSVPTTLLTAVVSLWLALRL